MTFPLLGTVRLKFASLNIKTLAMPGQPTNPMPTLCFCATSYGAFQKSYQNILNEMSNMMGCVSKLWGHPKWWKRMVSAVHYLQTPETSPCSPQVQTSIEKFPPSQKSCSSSTMNRRLTSFSKTWIFRFTDFFFRGTISEHASATSGTNIPGNQAISLCTRSRGTQKLGTL